MRINRRVSSEDREHNYRNYDESVGPWVVKTVEHWVMGQWLVRRARGCNTTEYDWNTVG